MAKRRRWQRLFAPTLGLRNSVLVALVGVVCFGLGVGLSFQVVLQPLVQWVGMAADRPLVWVVPPSELPLGRHLLGGILLLSGFYFMYRGFRTAMRHIFQVLNPSLRHGVADAFLKRQILARGPRVVVLGGGTGLSTLLRGLKRYTSNITAIVTVTDDGGSSGRLVQEKGMIPPGDIRNCLVALADAEKAMTDLFQHRFRSDSGALSGHSMGNLLLAALTDLSGGDFEAAVQAASEVLAIRGRVIPSTLYHVRLRAEMEDGTALEGETEIVKSKRGIRRVFLDPPDVVPHHDALQAIREADLVCIGPGSVYTSVIPNLLVPGVAQAIRDSNANKVYICNVMTQPGESDSLCASEHVMVLYDNVPTRVFDSVVVNTGVPTAAVLDRYRERGSQLVEPDIDRIRAMGLKVVTGNLMSDSDYVRHDPIRLAERLMELLKK